MVKKKECVVWPLMIDKYGYGVIKTGAGWVRAHRLIYSMFVAAIPEGMHVLHSCDNRACVNPDHLWVGTHAENMADAAKKGRMSLTGKPCAKLSHAAVAEIRASNKPVRELAAMYGVSKSTVQSAKTGKTWRKPT